MSKQTAAAKLGALLERRKWTVSEFARKAEVPRLTVSRIKNGSRPRAKLANLQKIIKASGGALKFEDFLE